VDVFQSVPGDRDTAVYRRAWRGEAHRSKDGRAAAQLARAKTGPDEGRSPGSVAGSFLIKCQYFTDVTFFSPFPDAFIL